MNKKLIEQATKTVEIHDTIIPPPPTDADGADHFDLTAYCYGFVDAARDQTCELVNDNVPEDNPWYEKGRKAGKIAETRVWRSLVIDKLPEEQKRELLLTLYPGPSNPCPPFVEWPKGARLMP